MGRQTTRLKRFVFALKYMYMVIGASSATFAAFGFTGDALVSWTSGNRKPPRRRTFGFASGAEHNTRMRGKYEFLRLCAQTTTAGSESWSGSMRW